ITIDVAYRYFATPVRKFIIADTPGHLQYTRNMVTGASTADLALVLVDARNGVVEQSRRHAFLAVLLGIPHIVLCVNKMDLVGWDRQVFDDIVEEFQLFVTGLGVPDVTAVPLSALNGDNVVDRSEHSPWYEGPALLEYLEGIEVDPVHASTGARFPVQYVLRPRSDEWHDFRGYAGTVAGGVLHPGDEVVVLPSGQRTTVASIDTADGPLEAAAGRAIAVRLHDDIDVSRGDMIAAAADAPEASREIEATICWFSERSTLTPRSKYLVKHTTRTVKGLIDAIEYRLDVNTLEVDNEATSLGLNEIGRVRLRTSQPIFVDPYSSNRATGSFVLIDEATNDTVAAGLVLDPAVAGPPFASAPPPVDRTR
ncbi:MAG TPA: GTP-binding protein, partial [Acidimicrobiales bacterium]